MQSIASAPGLADLRTVDRVARAAHLWIRHGRACRHLAPGEEYGPAHHNLAAGIISGLCEALELDHRCAVLSAYAYALLDSETEHALAIARPLFHRHIEPEYRAAYQAGREAAEDLIAILRWPEFDGVQLSEYVRGGSH